jgi:CBS domain containing-hemolysin-like protein
MADTSDSRLPREDGAEDQNSLSQHLRGWLRAIIGGRGDNSLRDALEELIEERESAETSIAADERVLLANILKLRDRTVVDAMVPRADIVAITGDITLPELIKRFSVEAHSRMPVYRDNLDDVVGMVHIKDVLACVADQKPFDMKAITREVLIVAPSMPVLDLLLHMRQTRQHMALVVDEFGGIDGLVTIEDLVEEIVGEIEDEHDEAVELRMVPRPDGSLIADARLPIEDFEDQVGRVFDPEELEDIDTLGGLVFSLAGRVPARGELLRHASGIEFEVIDADPRRIKRLRVRNLPAGAGSVAGASTGASTGASAGANTGANTGADAAGEGADRPARRVAAS